MRIWVDLTAPAHPVVFRPQLARLIAGRLGADHHEAILGPEVAEALPRIATAFSLDYRARRFVRAAHLPALEHHHGREIIAPAVRAQLLAPYLADDLLTKTDRMSMAHSVEVRVPFLDPVVAELAPALPTSAKVRGLAKKRLLRAVAATLLSREVARGAKRGFSIPVAAWLRGPLLPTARDLLAPAVLERGGVLDPAPVTRLLDEHVARRDDHSRALWGLLCFVLWQEQWRR
jgi:asparagine synthase (glutamine-hydrolysing)